MSGAPILVVEDEPAIADTIVYALRTEGFVPQWVSTGAAARDALAGVPPALVILDIGLPDVSGFDLCREIRRRWEMPVIILSARDQEIDRVVGLEIGADDYVVKPFSPRELVARVRARLRRHGPGAGGDFRIDESAQCIRFDDLPLPLTRYEYRLFAILLGRPRQVFSREALLAAAWDRPEEALDRTVDTHIKTLRQKLREAVPRRRPIVTHRGDGYSFDPKA